MKDEEEWVGFRLGFNEAAWLTWGSYATRPHFLQGPIHAPSRTGLGSVWQLVGSIRRWGERPAARAAACAARGGADASPGPGPGGTPAAGLLPQEPLRRLASLRGGSPRHVPAAGHLWAVRGLLLLQR